VQHCLDFEDTAGKARVVEAAGENPFHSDGIARACVERPQHATEPTFADPFSSVESVSSTMCSIFGGVLGMPLALCRRTQSHPFRDQ
jgi:hypothetical protein